VGSLFGIGIMSAIDIRALLGILVVIVIAVGFVGTVLFDIPFKYTVYVSIACLAIVAFLSLGPLIAAVLAIVGVVAYFIGPKSKPVYMLILAAVGIGAVTFGTVFVDQAAQFLGANPNVNQILEQGVELMP